MDLDRTADASSAWNRPDGVKDEEGRLPLHQACNQHGSGNPTAVALALLASFPDAATKKDCDGQLPLHIVCRNALIATPVALALLRAHPAAAQVKDRDGYLPLHLACGNSSCPVEVVLAIIAAHPAAVRERDRAGWFSLHFTCYTSSLPPEVALAVLAAYPAAVKCTNDHGMLPLHLVGANEGCHAEVALAVLAAYPDAAKKATNAGFHPLHGVCRSEGCSAEVALAILAAYPEATTAMAEYDARLPLHYACQNACCPAEVVLAVLAVFPEASERMDMDGNVPLHYVLQNFSLRNEYWNVDCSAEVALAVLAAYPGAAYTKGTDMAEGSPRYLPLHYVCDDPFVPADVALAVLDAHPGAAMERSMSGYDREMFGRLPLEVARVHTASWPPIWIAASLHLHDGLKAALKDGRIGQRGRDTSIGLLSALLALATNAESPFGPRGNPSDGNRARDKTVSLIRKAVALWSPSNHELYHTRFRKTIWEVMLVANRMKCDRLCRALRPVPIELWLCVCSFLLRGDWTVQ